MCEIGHSISVTLSSRCTDLQTPNSHARISSTPHGFWSILCAGFIFFPVETLSHSASASIWVSNQNTRLLPVCFANILRRPWQSCLIELFFLSLVKALLFMHSLSRECLAFSLQLLGAKGGFFCFISFCFVFHSSPKHQESKTALKSGTCFYALGGDNFY